MREPPRYLQPLLHTIESIVVYLYEEEFPQMTDKAVELTYDQPKTYFQAVSKGKSPEEPLSTSDMRQALLDEILNALEEREEVGADLLFINNPDIKPNGEPIPSLAALYVSAFNQLRKSVRFWRKEMGVRGYLSYVRQFL